MLDEDNEANLTDTAILDALNRAQDVASNILTRHYEDPMITSEEFTPDAGVSEFDIPERALEERLEKVEVRINGYYAPLERVSYRDISRFETDTTAAAPRAYVVTGNTYRLLPAASTSNPVRIWYSKAPLPLVKCEGRIIGTGVNGSSQSYVTLDSIGSSLSTSNTNLTNYVNLIDGDSGLVKATMQIIDIDPSCDRVTFKATPDRTSVLNQDTTGTLPATVEQDDYLSLVTGTCVPFFKKPNSNFVMQRAVYDIKANKLGEPTDAIARLDAELQKQVERSWTGREKTLKVHGDNVNWSRVFRRRWRTNN